MKIAKEGSGGCHMCVKKLLRTHFATLHVAWLQENLRSC